MKNIDFTKYPQILKYVSEHIDKSYFKPFQYTDLDVETFVNIFTDFINEYEKHRDVLIKNTLLIYNLTNEETGYQALSMDWDSWRETLSKRPKRITKELVEKWWDDKVSATISYIYQNLQHDGGEIKGGVTGCLITITYSIQFLDNDKKGYKYNVVSNFGFNVNIGHSIHNEYDLI